MAKPNSQELTVEIQSLRKSARITKFRELGHKLQGLTLLRLSAHSQHQLLKQLSDDEVIKILNFLDPDKTTRILRLLSPGRSKKLINKLNSTIREKVEFLLRFSPKTAAGLMSLDYIVVEKDNTVKEVAGEIAEHEKTTGKFPAVLVSERGDLLGEIQGHALVLHNPNAAIEPFIKKVPSLKYDSDEDKVVKSFINHPHNKVVVLDEDENILGIINSDEVIRFIDRRVARGLYGFAGVRDEEDVLDSALTKVKHRYKWLIINLGTAFLAASVVGLFENTISQFTLLAVYMPIVAGMGGNAGTQTLAVTVRGLVLKEVNKSTSRKIILKEMMAGATNGLINGVIVALVATVFNKSPLLGLVLGIAMVVNLIIAGLFGALIPMIMKALDKDPASSATIFITTATDVCGFFVFLGLASLVL